MLALALALAGLVRAGEVASLETETFLASEKSWRIIRYGYAQILPGHLKEIEASMPGRFFPGATVSALDHMDKGHFLKVVCGQGETAAPCPDKRNLLEARVVAATFLEAAPKTHRIDELVDMKTFSLKPLGRSTIAKCEKAAPDFWDRLKKMTADVVGTKASAFSATADP